MILNYLALGILLAGLILVFYGFIYIHDLPYKIAKKRNHPQKEAIHVAGWLSLFTLHALWPIVYIWSVTRGDAPTFASDGSPIDNPNKSASDDLNKRLQRLEERLLKLENPPTKELPKGNQ